MYASEDDGCRDIDPTQYRVVPSSVSAGAATLSVLVPPRLPVPVPPSQPNRALQFGKVPLKITVGQVHSLTKFFAIGDNSF